MATCSLVAEASEVAGKIILQKSLGKEAVAPTAYDLRGVAVQEPLPIGHRVSQFERVAVWLESDRPSMVEPVEVTMQQRNRRFEPELLVVPTGSTVDFPNLDFMFHNIFSLSRTQAFDLGYYPKGQSRKVTFSRPGIVQVYCHVHSNMYAAIVVTSSHWSGKPGQDGAFAWPDVPPGKYRLMVWQRFGGLYRKDMEVPAVGDVNVTMTIPEEDRDHP